MAKIIGERWQIINQLTTGGQGHIYAVKDLNAQDDEKYILKKLKNPKKKERFEKEIEAVKSIDSPYLPELIDYGISERGDSYYVMNFFSDMTLQDILEELKDDYLRCLKIFEKICEGIEAAHKNQPSIIHRDLKPANILIDKKDNPQIIDWGICYIEEGSRHTLEHEQVGSDFYISPECEAGKSNLIKPHTDIYSLGKILYAMASGGNIFPREDQNELNYSLISISSNRRAKLIMEIINHCVRKDISKRFSDVKDLLKLVNNLRELIERGYLPVNYSNDLCRFCGRGTLIKLGKFPGSRGEHNQFDPIKIFGWKCYYCGLIHLFDEEIYESHK